MMLSLIQGPKQLGNDIDVYLKPLVDEILQLLFEGIHMWDEFKRKDIDLRALLFITNKTTPHFRTYQDNLARDSWQAPIA
jgi:hypothetical protein